VARECKVHPVTVARWIARLRKQGIAGLLGQKSLRGRKSKLTKSHLQVLKEAAVAPPRSLGKPYTRWTLARLARHFSNQTGISVQSHYLGRLLRRMGIGWSHGTESFDASWFQEVEVFWFTVVRSKRPHSATPKEGQEDLLVGVNLATGRLTGLKVRRRSSSSVARFLEQLIDEYPKKKVLLIGQRESIHITKQLDDFLRSNRERITVSLWYKSSQPDERHFHTLERCGDLQFLGDSPEPVAALLNKGIRQIEQLLRL